jgi:hypothetical protein
MWWASTSIHASTIADPSRSPSRRSSGLSLRRTYRAMARDSGIRSVREIKPLELLVGNCMLQINNSIDRLIE